LKDRSGADERPAVGRIIIAVIIVVIILAAALIVGVSGIFTSSSSSVSTVTVGTSSSATTTSTSTTTSTTPASTSSTATTTSSAPASSSSSPGSSTSSSTTTSSSTSTSVTTVPEHTTSVTSTQSEQFPSTFLTSTGEGSPSYGTTAGQFGEALAAGSSFLVVGAPNETSAAQVGAGNVYIYSSAGSLFETLTSPSPQLLGAFGWSVAVSGSSVIVGAPGENASKVPAAGQVYIFSATTGKLLKTLSSPNSESGGEFGVDMAASGSLLVVGAILENTTVGFAGRAYVYNVTTGSLIGTLQSPNPQYEGEFGSTTYATPGYVVVAAQNETTGNNVGAGRVYVYSATSLSLIRTLTSPEAQAGGEFGFSLTGTGSTLVVGAPFEAVDDVSQVGNVYAFNIASGALLQTFSGSTAVQAVPPNFGYMVAAGYGYIAVGAPYNGTVVSSTAITGGAVYLYNATSFALITTMTAPSEPGGYYSSSFGYALAIGPGMLSVGDPEAIHVISTTPGYDFPGDAFIFEVG